MKRGFISVASCALILAAVQSAWAQPLTSIDVLGELQNRRGKTIGAFEGTLDIVEFAVNDAGDLVANGELSGDVLNRGGRVIRSIEDVPVTLPVTEIIGSDEGVCEVLSLSLGPLDLNLLGLMIHLDEVNLDLTADPAGGILGQLLCGLAGGLGLDLGDLLDLDLGFLVALLDLFDLLDDLLGALNLIGS
jgi:hypothetical protein